MNYDGMTDEQLWQFAKNVADNSISAEDVRRKIFGLGYPFSFLFVEEKASRRGFKVMFHGHHWLISVK